MYTDKKRQSLFDEDSVDIVSELGDGLYAVNATNGPLVYDFNSALLGVKCWHMGCIDTL
jgi:hypothetical protein